AHAGRALRELETGVEVVQQLRGIVAGRIRLGTSASFSIYLLPPALRRFRSRYPKAELTVVTGNAPEIARAVVGRLLDVGIVSLPVRERELAVTPFYRDEVVAIAPPDRRWRRGQRAAARDLVSAPLILFERGGDPPPRDRRLVSPRRRGPRLGDGARQHGGDQEARRGGTRALGHVVVLGRGGGTAAEARGGAARPAALPGDRRHPPARQAADARARGVPGDASGPPPGARVGRRAGGPGRGPT